MPEYVLILCSMQHSKSFRSCRGSKLAGQYQRELRHIHTISAEGSKAHFDSIDSKLSTCEILSEGPMWFALAIPNNDNIVLRVLSFL